MSASLLRTGTTVWSLLNSPTKGFADGRHHFSRYTAKYDEGKNVAIDDRCAFFLCAYIFTRPSCVSIHRVRTILTYHRRGLQCKSSTHYIAFIRFSGADSITHRLRTPPPPVQLNHLRPHSESASGALRQKSMLTQLPSSVCLQRIHNLRRDAAAQMGIVGSALQFL